MFGRFLSPARRLGRAQKKVAHGKFEDALVLLVAMLNAGADPELLPAIYLAMAECESGCGNLRNAAYYAGQCEQMLPGHDGSDADLGRGTMRKKARDIQSALLETK